MNLYKTSLFCVLTLAIASVANAQNKVIFKENFRKDNLQKNWLSLNGDWQVKDFNIQGNKDANWAILLCNKPLPENYILTFSSLAEPETYLFEVMLNLNHNKFLGILLNQFENRVAIEDRGLFANVGMSGSFIHSVGHIGTMPKVERPKEHTWQDWKIQRTGNQFFVWINNEAITFFNDSTDFVKTKGQFGFAINGKASIKDITLMKTKGESSLPPKDFKGKPRIKPFFVFE
ncbi:hypothetical protein [Pedobacter sp. FW305-3-2-15-E-R2A2]|uniref:hypothetical protein n=1 Tax=Pedobacter sp. FW305-3-2-15-E-R2A2 TaxID=3140251 RepID=UPI00314046EF